MLLMLMIPILLTIVPGMLYQSMRLLARKKSTLTHYVWTYTMMLYIWLVFSVTGIGSIWDVIAKGGWAATVQQANISWVPFQLEGIFTYCMNVIMLMPLGFLLPYIWKNFRNPFKVAFTGFLLSVFIEFAQVPTNRLVDVDDVMMNTLGTMLGYLVWKTVGKHFSWGKEAQRTVSLGSCEPVIYLITGLCLQFSVI